MRCAGAALLAILLGLTPPAVAEAVQSLDVHTPFAPALVEAGGAPQLAYELHLTNFASRPIRIDRIAVHDAETGAEIGGAEGDGLAPGIGRIGASESDDPRLIEAGARAIVYLNLPLGARPAPAAVSHRIKFHFPNEDSRELAGPDSRVERQPLPVLGPPLRGGPWVAVYEPGMARGHRRVVYATDGHARIPGRFAIDWFKIDERGETAAAGETRVAGHHGHGAEVLAVADGVIAAVRDDMMEPTSTEETGQIAIGDATGNYVALDLGNGRFAFYEHLRPGIDVRVGDRVRRGQVIARLGFTGQTTGPHLHFHLADANSPLGAEGLPYRIDGVEILGSYPSIAAFAHGGPWDAPRQDGRAGPLFPGPNTVVRFAAPH